MEYGRHNSMYKGTLIFLPPSRKHHQPLFLIKDLEPFVKVHWKKVESKWLLCGTFWKNGPNTFESGAKILMNCNVKLIKMGRTKQCSSFAHISSPAIIWNHFLELQSKNTLFSMFLQHILYDMNITVNGWPNKKPEN